MRLGCAARMMQRTTLINRAASELPRSAGILLLRPLMLNQQKHICKCCYNSGAAIITQRAGIAVGRKKTIQQFVRSTSSAVFHIPKIAYLGGNGVLILYIVRHGHFQRQASLEAHNDSPLTAIGIKQAELTGQWLKDKGIETLYCSPSIRTLMTASIIGKALNLRPKAWIPLTELGFFGHESGLTGKEMRIAFPDVEFDESFSADRGWAAHITKESVNDLFRRARTVEGELRSRHGSGNPTIAIVSHAHFARYLLASLLGISNADGWTSVIDHNNCGVSCVEIRPGAVVLRYTNAHFHLGDLVT